MRKPKQLTLVKRYQIAVLRKAGLNQSRIAEHLRVHKSTISRELRRNRGRRGYRPRQAQGLSVSHESIYRHVEEDKSSGGDLHTHLRCRKKRRKRYGAPSRMGHIKNRVCIDERPEIVDERSRIGDWEADTVLGSGKRGKVIVTLAERKSRYCMILVSEDKKASSVSRATLEAAVPMCKCFETVTCDNGKEFASHEEISSKLSAYWYFAHPYHS